MRPTRLLLKRLVLAVSMLMIAAVLVYWLRQPGLPEWRGVDFGLDGTSASVFAPDKMLVFDFELKPEDLKRMKDQAREEVSVPAQLDVGNTKVGLVGLRFKGAVGTLLQPLDAMKAGGPMPKLSMKVAFDKHVEGQRFNTLRKLNFHSMIHDRALVKERLAYQVFREAGFPAP